VAYRARLRQHPAGQAGSDDLEDLHRAAQLGRQRLQRAQRRVSHGLAVARVGRQAGPAEDRAPLVHRHGEGLRAADVEPGGQAWTGHAAPAVAAARSA
jgi:hypothetical protein